MASPDPFLNIWMLDDDSEEPEEFTALDAIFNSQETSEEIKTNVFALKQKYRKLYLSYASHLHLCKQNSEATALEMENLTTIQQDLQEDVRAADKYMEELQRNIIKLEMKTTMGNEALWNDFEATNRENQLIKQDLATKSDLLQDYNVYSASIQARNTYLEDKCADLLQQLKNAGVTAVVKEQECVWQITESSIIFQRTADSIETTPSTSSDRIDVKGNHLENLEMQIIEMNATAAKNGKELDELKNKLEDLSKEKICLDTDNKKICEEKRILQLEMENLLIKINKLTKSVKFLENYYKEKLKTTMSTIEGVHHPILDKLIMSHNKSKSESDVMSKQWFANKKGTTYDSLSKSTTHLEPERSKVKIMPTEQLLSAKLHSSLVGTLAEENQETKKSENDNYDAIKIELTDANKKITELTTECHRLKEDIGELKNNKSSLEKLNWSLDNRVEILFKEKEKAIAELEILKKKLAEFATMSQPGDADTKVKIEAELSAKMSEEQSAQSVKEEMPERKDTSEGVLQLQTASVQEPVIQKSVGTETEVAPSNVDANVELNQKLSQIEQELKDLKKEESLKCKNETLVRMLQDDFKIKETMKSQIVELNDEIKTLRLKIVVLEEETNTAKVSCENEKENSKSVQSDLRKQQECLETKLRDCKSERVTLLETITEGNRKLEILAETNKALENGKKKLEEEKERIVSQNTMFCSEIRSLKEKIKQKSENLLRMHNEILASKQRVNELNTLVTELTSERDQLKIKNDESNENIKTCEEHKRDLQAKKDMLELKLQNIETEVQSSNANYAIKIKGLEDEKNALAAEKLQLQTTLQSTEEKLIVQKSANLKCLESVEGDIQHLFYELTLENTVLQSDIKVLSAQIKDQEEAIKKEKAKVDKYKTELTWQQDVFNNHEKRIRKLKAECLEKDKLQTELEEKKSSIQDCLERIKQLNSSLDEAGDTVRQHQAENADIKSKLIQALSNESRMRDLLEEMNNKIEAFKSSISESVQHLEYVQCTFVPPSSAMEEEEEEEEEPNLAASLSIIRTNLVNIVDDLHEPVSTESGTNISEMLEDLHQKETELAQVKRQILELDSNYTAVFQELRTMKSQQESEALLKECAQCLNLTEKISDLESRIDMIESNEVSDEIVQSYRDHCDYLTKRIKQLEKEKQKMHVQPSQSSETQYTTELENELLALKNKYDKLKIVARMRLTEIHELKSRLGYDPGQGRSTDP